MDIRQLEVFVSVVERGSLTEAARALGVTQPAVSGAVSKLEGQLGFALFRREGRGVLPTAEARQLYPEACQALRSMARVSAVAGSIAATEVGTLTVAANPGPAVAWLPKVAAAFRRGRPDVRLRLLSRASHEVREMAAVGAFDLGLAEAPFGRSDTLVRRYRLPMVAAVHPLNPLAAQETVTARLLHGQEFVATVASPWTWAGVTRALDEAGAEAKVVVECEFMATALHMAAAGAGLCLCDSASADDARLRGLVVRPFEPATVYEIGVLEPRRGGLTRLASAFAEAVHVHLSPFAAGGR
jgi:DNA-binding transcriptional LysR family regulator